MKALAAANISLAWPYRQAQQSIRQLIDVSISHEQIRQLCLQEAVRAEAQEQVNF